MSRPAPGARSEPVEVPSGASLSTTPPSAPPPQPAPGPWSLVTASKVDGRGEFHLFVADRDGRKICAVWTRGEEKLATGYLMEAAPDLRDAIRDVLDDTMHGNVLMTPRTVAKLHAALAKAEGKPLRVHTDGVPG